MDSNFMEDLGAASLDLLDLSFLIEEAFGITLTGNEFQQQVTERLSGGAYEKDGFLTEAALAELRRLLPEVPAEKLQPPLPRVALPGVLNVAVFVHLIDRKLAEPRRGCRDSRIETMLQDKLAVVTGGSGAVGGAIVRALAREGCRVAYHVQVGGRQGARRCRRSLPPAGPLSGPTAWTCSIGRPASSWPGPIEEQLGPVDVLVNNAGLAQVLPFAMIEEQDWDLMMDVNVKGMFLVTKAFARGMIRRKSGSIVNVGSLAGMRMLEVPVHYATAKSAVVGFTLSLARELGRYHVRVNAVVPGMLSEGVSVNVPAAQRKEYETYCALGRVGRPEEVAELVAFLASAQEQLHQRPGDSRRRGDLMKFRMVDRILAWQPRQSIRGVKVVSFEEYQYKEPLADEPCLPESLLVESLFQLGNWLVVLSSDFTEMALVVRFEEIRFAGRLRPGESLRMEVEVRSYRSDGVVLDGRGLVGTRDDCRRQGMPGDAGPSGRLPGSRRRSACCSRRSICPKRAPTRRALTDAPA